MINYYYILVTMLENVSVQIPMVIFFNPAEPEATLKRPQSFGNDKTYLVSRNTLFLGVFAQDRVNIHMWNPCYPQCNRKFQECFKYYRCSDRPQSEWNRCLTYCNKQSNSCMDKCQTF